MRDGYPPIPCSRRDPSVRSGAVGSPDPFAMQKVVGSSPIIRFTDPLETAGFFLPEAASSWGARPSQQLVSFRHVPNGHLAEQHAEGDAALPGRGADR